MGKSKKSTPKVEAVARVTVPEPTKKKGKREVEETVEKVVSTKKQKVENDGATVAKKLMETKTQKKKKKEESSSSESDDEPKKPVTKKTVPSNKQPPQKTSVKGSKKDSSSDSSESSESDSDHNDEKSKGNSQVKKPLGSIVKNGNVKRDDDSDSDSDASSEEEKGKVNVSSKNALAAKTGSLGATKKKDESSSSDSSDSDESEDIMDAKPAASIVVKAQAQGKKAEIDTDDYSDDDDDDDESDSEKDTKKVASKVSKAQLQGKEADSESEFESDDDDSDSDKDVDVKMVDASKPGKDINQISDKKSPKTPGKSQSQGSGSTTIYVGNLPYSAKQEDVENLFKDVGEINEVRYAGDQNGNFKGYAHVEFATAEDAEKALALQPLDLGGRTLRLNLSEERGSFTPSNKESNSFQKGGRTEGQTLFVRGFDKSLGEDEIRTALEEHFGSCGEITRVSIPKDYESGAVKGIAYMDFKDSNGLNSALELNGSELGGYSLQVEQARPKGDSRSDGGDRSSGRRGGRGGDRFSGGRGGDRFSGRRGGRGGDWSGDGSDGRGSGGRFGRRGGRGGFGGDRGRGYGRGRGTPNKFGIGAGRGKKTTFGADD